MMEHLERLGPEYPEEYTPTIPHMKYAIGKYLLYGCGFSPVIGEARVRTAVHTRMNIASTLLGLI